MESELFIMLHIKSELLKDSAGPVSEANSFHVGFIAYT